MVSTLYRDEHSLAIIIMATHTSSSTTAHRIPLQRSEAAVTVTSLDLGSRLLNYS